MTEHLNVSSKFSNTLYKILDTAFVLFVEKGYAAVTIADVYKKTGVSRGAVRGYFEQKIELLDALAFEVLDEIDHKMLIITNDDSLDFQEKISQLLDLSYQYPQHFSLIKQAENVVDSEQKLQKYRKRLENFKMDMFNFFNENIKELQTENERLKNYSSEDIAVLIYSCFESVYTDSLPKIAPRSKEIIEKNINFILQNEQKT